MVLLQMVQLKQEVDSERFGFLDLVFKKEFISKLMRRWFPLTVMEPVPPGAMGGSLFEIESM